MTMPKQSASSYFQGIARLLSSLAVTDRDGASLALDQGADQAVAMMLQTAGGGGRIFVIGNGGSAAIAAHLQGDLGRSLGRCLAFHDIPTLTALANDFKYRSVFASPLKAWAEAGDLLVAISSSGNSDNILEAVAAAQEAGCRVITLTGFREDNRLRRRGDLNFHVASSDYGQVESAHAVLAHYLSDMAQQRTSLHQEQSKQT